MISELKEPCSFIKSHVNCTRHNTAIRTYMSVHLFTDKMCNACFTAERLYSTAI